MWPDVFAILWPPLWSWLFVGAVSLVTGRRPVRGYRAYIWSTAAAGCMLADALGGFWIAAGISAASLIIGIAVWWWRRKDRKRATDAIGAKSRALRDAIVKRAKDASRGARPVLRPVPEGAS